MPGRLSSAAETRGRITLKSWRLRIHPAWKLFTRLLLICQSRPLVNPSPRMSDVLVAVVVPIRSTWPDCPEALAPRFRWYI